MVELGPTMMVKVNRSSLLSSKISQNVTHVIIIAYRDIFLESWLLLMKKSCYCVIFLNFLRKKLENPHLN